MAKAAAKVIFMHGESWRHAWMAMGAEIGKGRMELMMPMMVARAFSFELYLKSLLTIEGKDIPRYHDLRKLFDLVSEERQAKIRHVFSMASGATRKALEAATKHLETKMPPFTFDAALNSSAKAFEKLRYAYETDELGEGEGWMASEVSEGTRKVILEEYPDWGHGFRHTINSP